MPTFGNAVCPSEENTKTREAKSEPRARALEHTKGEKPAKPEASTAGKKHLTPE